MKGIVSVLAIGTAVWLAAAPLAIANEWSAAARLDRYAIDGVKGYQGIRTDPATVAGVAYAHPVQLDVGDFGGSFVAVGTYNGSGTNASPTHNCADDYDSRWSIYTDGETNNVYWCYTQAQDVYAAGSNPSFQIYYTFCSPSGPVSWVLTFDGVQRRCVQDTAYASAATVGLETVNTIVDRNIDVKYTSVNVNLTGSTSWVAFASNFHDVDPDYSLTIVSNKAVNAYKAPLD